MSIYRGAGGSGDAVNDASSEALLTVQAKDAALAAQAAAETAATNAQTAETNAETAETNAETAATSAAASLSTVAASASAAATSASNASTSASAASTSATNSANSASAASTSASNASTSASTATTQAGIATTQASNASTSATNAASSATTASAAASAALASLDSFDDRYLGSKSSAPTLDNDGNALVSGALYFNTVSNTMKVYTGSVWVDAYADGATFLAKANNLSDLPSASTARTNLGLGTAATTASTDYATAAQGTLAGTALQPATIGSTVQGYAADLQAIGALAGTTGLLKKTAANTWSLDTSAYLTSAVTSVTGTSPVVSSGGNTPAISLASGYGDTQNPYASKTANYVLAAPNGTAGAPTFRAVVAADIPTLNQNTTGTASNVTGTVAVGNGGTGATTLTANNVLLGNGTSALQVVAPSTAGNVLTSNGTTWTSAAAGGGFATGTVLLFYQAAAPTGWTQVTTQNNKALRIVSGTGGGTGGTVAFTTAFVSQAVSGSVGTSGATTLSTSQIPSHQHLGGTSVQFANGNFGTAAAGGNSNQCPQSGQNDNHDYTSYVGGGGSHTHDGGTFTGTAINLAVQYIDVIIASKN